MVRNKRLLLTVAMILAVALAGWLLWVGRHQPKQVPYNQFLELVTSGEVREVYLRDGQVGFVDIYGRHLHTFAPDVTKLVPRLVGKGVVVRGEPDRPSPFWHLAALVLLVLTVVAAWLFLAGRNARRLEEEGAGGFAAARVTGRRKGTPQVTFRDVAGLPEAKEELLEIIDFLQKSKKYSRLGAIIPRGILFQGPPGTGKTLLAKAVAGEAGVPFYSISGSDFVEMFVGVGASRVRELFREAKKNAPCIIFIDEIDAVGARRSGFGSAGGQEERGQTLNALLVEMDGFGSEETVVVLAATNRPDILDPALLRPGRFDRQITVPPPDVAGRQQILEVHLRRIRTVPDLDVEEIARATPGFTGAELANLVNEAALIAGRRGKKAVDLDDVEAAKDRVLMGVERRGMVISESDRRTMAYHEAGHAVLARCLPEADPLRKISIIPRGRAMGHTQQQPLQDRQVYSREYLRSRIIILLGGRAAEELALGQQTTGGADDFRQAREIAQNMVCRWGMDDLLGPMSYWWDPELPLEQQYLAYGPEAADMVDREVKRLVENCYQEARAILASEQRFLCCIAEVLLRRETLLAEELEALFGYACQAVPQAGEEGRSPLTGLAEGEIQAALQACQRLGKSGGSRPVAG